MHLVFHKSQIAGLDTDLKTTTEKKTIRTCHGVILQIEPKRLDVCSVEDMVPCPLSTEWTVGIASLNLAPPPSSDAVELIKLTKMSF